MNISEDQHHNKNEYQTKLLKYIPSDKNFNC